MRVLSVLVCCVLMFTAFSQVRETETGLKHEFFIRGNKGTFKIGDLVTLNMLVKSSTGKEIRNSWNEGKPLLFPTRLSSFDADIYEAVRLMSIGDSAKFWVNADSMYLKIFKKEMPEEVKPGTDLEVVIKTYKARSQKEYKDEQSDFYTSNLKEDKVIVDKRMATEDLKIKEYIKSSGFDYKKTASGAYYAITDLNGGKQLPKDGNAVVFSYVGQFMDGTVFESTEKDIGHAINFTLGRNSVIKGWEEVFPNIPKGARARMVIPSHLGYGNIAKDEKIPANSILIFDVQLVAIY